MPVTSAATRARTSGLRRFRPLLSAPSSKALSTITSPSPSDISDLILRQASPTGALSTFQWATTLPSFHHTPTTQAALVRSLVSFRRFDAATAFVASLPSPPHDDVLLALIRGHARARLPREAVKVLDLVPKPSLKVCNSVLDVLIKYDIDVARSFYRKRMASCGVGGDEHTFGILMKGLCRTNRIDEGFKLLKLAKMNGLGANPVIYNTLIHALCRNGKVGRARSLMSGMEKPSDVTFNIMISAYCSEGELVKALVMVEKCFDLGLVPDIVATTKLIALLCKEGRMMEAVGLLGRVEEKGGKLDVLCYNTLIVGFCKVGRLKAGHKVMKEMELNGKVLPNTQTYNVLISANCVSGEMDAAMDLFREMRMAGVDADFETFNTLIRGFCFAGRVVNGYRLLTLMREQSGGEVVRIEPYNSIVYGLYKEGRLEEAHGFLGRMRFSFPRAVGRSLMILGYCHVGKVLDAKKMFDDMVEQGDDPSVLVYAGLVDGLCRREGGDLRDTFDVVNEMMNRGYRPMVSMCNMIINGFCKKGEVGSGLQFLEEMAGRRCPPDADSYGFVISGLCRANNKQKACDLLGDMVGKGLVPNSLTWNALVVCMVQNILCVDVDGKVHSDMELEACGV